MFITFEGIDGSGKTTMLEKLSDYLNQKNINFILTREPGNHQSLVSKRIREIILSKDSDMNSMAEALLYAADRRINLERVIWPSLKEGKIVLCDRFIDSSLAYQGHARGIGIDEVYELQKLITNNTIPDLTIYFDVTLENSANRKDNRVELDRLESLGDDFNKKVFEGYKLIIDKFPDRIKVIDANGDVETTFSNLISVIDHVLKIQ